MSAYKYVYWFKRIRPNAYKPVILITGCASGIGLELAKVFTSVPNYRVVITARKGSIDKLHDVFPPSQNIRVYELDITDEVSRKQVVGKVCAEWEAPAFPIVQ